MTKETQETHTHQGGRFLLGLIAGSAIGAGVALYVVPRLVSELRRRAGGRADRLGQATSDSLEDVVTRVANVVDRVVDVASDVTKRGQAVRDDVADAVARGAQEVARRAREVEQIAKAAKTGH